MRRVLITPRCFNCCRAVLILSQGHLSFLLCPANGQAAGAVRAGRGQTQDRWPKLAKGVFHTIWRHAKQYIGVASWGEGAGLLGVRLGIGQRVVSNCIVHHLFSYTLLLLILLSLSLLLLLLLLLYSLYSLYYYIPVLINCLYLNSPASLSRFSPPSQRGRGEGERTAVWCLAASRVKPQQSFWCPTWGPKGWDIDQFVQSVLN